MNEKENPIKTAEALAKAIMETRQHRLEAEANRPPFKPRRHYASGLNGCARQMVYAINNWEEKEKFTPEAIANMQDGNHEEKLLIQELLSDGFDVVESQVQIDDDKYWVTGKIDGKLKWLSMKIPFEIKRMKPYTFEKMNAIEDLRSNPFTLKYLRQLTLYLYLHSVEAGLFILSDGLGNRKVIAVPMDYTFAESILKDLDTANKHIKAETLPERIPYSSKVCGYCSFRKTCLPDMDFGQGAVMGGEELNQAVKRLQEIKGFSSEAEKLKEGIKKATEGKPLTICGDYVVEGAWAKRTTKAQPAKPESVSEYWKFDIEKTVKQESAT